MKGEIDFSVPTEEQSAHRFALTYELFEELHRKYHEPFIQEMGRLAKAVHPSATRKPCVNTTTSGMKSSGR